MAASSVIQGKSEDYISTTFQTCLESFKDFLQLLSLRDNDSNIEDQFGVGESRILEEYGRFKIWGDQSHAQRDQALRGSLDDSLRHDYELQGLVKGILNELGSLLRQLATISQGQEFQINDENNSSSEDSSSDWSSEGDPSENVAATTARTMPRSRRIVEQAFDQIRALYDLSSLLRRPKLTDKYIRSFSSAAKQELPPESQTITLEGAFSKLDESHVIEKMLQWQGATKASIEFDHSTEVVAPIHEHIRSRDCEADLDLWLCHRLARANTRRREQLQYWIDHPYDPSAPKAPPPTESRIPDQAPVALPELASAMLDMKLETVDPMILETLLQDTKSVASRVSFSTAPISDVYGTMTETRPRTIYAETAVGDAQKNSVPEPPPVEEGQISFICPYCGMTLNVQEMKSRQTWKRHVFRDLRPYLCTFEDCQTPDKMYLTRHEWVHHEFQFHRREYACKPCGFVTQNRNDMAIHLRAHYDDSVSKARFGFILDLCERQADTAGSQKESCLFCGAEKSLPRLHDHLAIHLESLALFVLPTVRSGDDDASSEASGKVAKRGSDNTLSLSHTSVDGSIASLRSLNDTQGNFLKDDETLSPEARRHFEALQKHNRELDDLVTSLERESRLGLEAERRLDELKQKYAAAKEDKEELKHQNHSLRQKLKVLGEDSRVQRLQLELERTAEQARDWKSRLDRSLMLSTSQEERIRKMRDNYDEVARKNEEVKVENRRLRDDNAYFRRAFGGGP